MSALYVSFSFVHILSCDAFGRGQYRVLYISGNFLQLYL
jgi:hypothetical protein